MERSLLMSIRKKPFGHTAQGEPIAAYTLTNSQGASVTLSDFGGIITQIWVPDRAGKLADVSLGFDEAAPYVAGKSGSMGALIGRYGNRIGAGRLTVAGQTCQLRLNNGKNHLHGGPQGFGVRLWEAEPQELPGEDRLILKLDSPDGDENYPGHLQVAVTYTFDNSNTLSIRYQAVTDKPTVVNMTNHAYFNLAGHNSGEVTNQLLTVAADAITPVDAGLIPTGGYLPVAGTPFDLRTPTPIGKGLAQIASCPQMALAGGYDHNFVLRKGCAFGLAARLEDPVSGRVLEVLTDQPGVQVYSACQTDFANGKGGARYGRFCAVCLETQHFPDSPNQPHFPSTCLNPGEVYDTTTLYAFSTAP